MYWILYQFSFAAAFNTTVPTPEEMDWMSEAYPDTFDRHYRPLWERARRLAAGGQPLLLPGSADALPGLPDPDGLHRAR